MSHAGGTSRGSGCIGLRFLGKIISTGNLGLARFGRGFWAFCTISGNRVRDNAPRDPWQFRETTGGCVVASELLDGRFRFQQDGNAVADGVHALALVALHAVFAAQHQWLAAHRTGKDFQQVGRNHTMAILAA